MSETTERTIQQQPEGVDGRRVGLLALGAIGITVACLLLIWWILPPRFRGPMVPKPPGETISGVEQSNIGGTAKGLRRKIQARKRLDRYGWVDREAGIAEIPIDRAMDLYVNRARREKP